jgi:lysozyme family protein
MTFDDAFTKLIDPRREGGYSTDPTDRGNWTGGAVNSGELRGTKYGISAARYWDLDIKNLTEDDAKSIYLRDFWRPVIQEFIPPDIRFALFDMAVNSGPGFASKTLQKAVGVTPDGEIGPVTRQAIAAIDPKALANRINAIRLDEMTRFSGWKNNSRGWARRIAQNILDDNSL